MSTNVDGAEDTTLDTSVALADDTLGIRVNADGVVESYVNVFGETTFFIPRMAPLRKRRSCILTDSYKLIGLTTSKEERLLFIRQYFSFATISGFASAMGYSRHTIAHFFKEEGDRRSIVIPSLSRGSNTIIMDLEVAPRLIEMNFERNKRSCSLEDRKKLYFQGMAIADKYRAESYESRKLLSWALKDRAFVFPHHWARKELAMLKKYDPEFIQVGMLKLISLKEVRRLVGWPNANCMFFDNKQHVGILDIEGGNNYKETLENLPPVIAPLFPASLRDISP